MSSSTEIKASILALEEQKAGMEARYSYIFE